MAHTRFYVLKALHGIAMGFKTPDGTVCMTASNNPSDFVAGDSDMRMQLQTAVTGHPQGAVHCSSENGTDFVVRPLRLDEVRNIISIQSGEPGRVLFAGNMPNVPSSGMMDSANQGKVKKLLGGKPTHLIITNDLNFGALQFEALKI